MCRMFGFSGPAGLAARLQEALIDAARRDPFAGSASHGDGWGGVWVTSSKLTHYRSAEAIYSSAEARGFFGSTDGAHTVGLSHARKAAPKEPIRGAYDSHPFVSHLGDDLVFVAHNGWIDKYRLGLEGVDLAKTNDTEVFCLLLEREFCGDFTQTVENAFRRVYHAGANKGALNILFLRLTRGAAPEVYYYSDYDERKERYYRLHVYRRGDGGGVAVMSSTVAYMAGLIDAGGRPLNSEVQPAPKKELVRLQ